MVSLQPRQSMGPLTNTHHVPINLIILLLVLDHQILQLQLPVMHNLTFQNPMPIASLRVCCIKIIQSKNVVLSPLKKLSRRTVTQFIATSCVVSFAGSISAASMPQMIEPDTSRTVKLGSGVRFQEIIEGEGPEAHAGDLVEFNYICRRSNGYFVYSTVDQFSGESAPVILRLDQNQIIEGLKQVMVGMKVGVYSGLLSRKRRALIPPSVGYINGSLQPIPEEFGPRCSLLSHLDESLVFEVQLLKVF